MAEQKTDAFSIYPSPLQDELRGLHEMSKSHRRRAGYLQELFAAVQRDDQHAAEVVLECWLGRCAFPLIDKAVVQGALLLIRPVASEVTLHLLTYDESRELQQRVWGHSLDAQTTERVRVLVRMDASPTSCSAHDAIDRLASAVTLGLSICDKPGDDLRPSGGMKDWDGELSEQQWTVFKEALDIPAQNDVAALLKMLDEELTNAMVQARAVHGGGIRQALTTASLEPDDGANGDTASRKNKGSGRKPSYDAKKDDKTARDWKAASASGESKPDFAASKGMKTKDLQRLLNRERGRKRRAH